MKEPRRLRIFAVCVGALPPLLTTLTAGAQQVSVSGSNTVRLERYESRGALASSPYPFTGSTGFDEIALNLGWQPSAYDRWRGFITGVINDSPYRSPDRDVVPERIGFTRENGEAAIPYRMDAGDFFAFTTFRTQQRALKGFSIELQPIPADDKLRSSILVFAGAAQPSWRHLQWNDDNTMGLSWLTEWQDKRITVNVLRNSRGANLSAGERTQSVASLAAEAPFRAGDMHLRAEAEIASLRGDHDNAQGIRDSGLFAQLSGRYAKSSINWRLRGERYGADYQPFGAAVTPDRRSTEAHIAGIIDQSFSWRARVQRFHDQAESANPQDTNVAGLGLSGPWQALNATVNVDVFTQSLKRRDGSVNQDATTFNVFIAKPWNNWLLQTSLLWQSLDDKVVADNQPRTKQIGVTLLKPVQWGRWSGSVGPGLTWRDISGGLTNSRDITVTLAMNLTGGPHRFALNAGRLAQNPSVMAAPDVATVNLGLDYRYRHGQHEFGFDVTLFDRKPTPGEKTEAWKAGVTWVWQFDRQSRTTARPAATLTSSPQTPLTRSASLLADVAPGTSWEATLSQMAAAGLAGGLRSGNAMVFEARLLDDIEQRQRVVLVEDGGRVARTALVVALGDGAGADDAARIHERVLRQLIERFGRPSSSFEQGSFGPTYANDIASGKLIRIAEWTTSAGTLRMGIPRRLDGVARIEIIHAAGFGSPRDGNWGMETVR